VEININKNKTPMPLKTSNSPIRLLLSERAALGKSGLTTGWLAENGCARSTNDDGLGVGEDGGDVETTWALDVHEERSWLWNKSLELVLATLSGWVWVEEIFS